MRAFATIIKDSFRETIVSKTMWVLLGLATLFLAAIAPFSIDVQGAKGFEHADVRDGEGLSAEIQRQAAANGPSPGKRIDRFDAEKWPRDVPIEEETEADDETDAAKKSSAPVATEPGDEDDVADEDVVAHENARDVNQPQPPDAQDGDRTKFPRSGSAWMSLNRATSSRELYDEKSWAEYTLPDEANDLIARGVDSLDDDEVARLNRLLIEVAYRRFLHVASEKSFAYYGPWQIGGSLPPGLTKAFVLSTVLAVFTDWILGVFGVMAALLVTSSFIPRTFEPGAVDLLLSKPVSRALVFLAKFAGGCLFIGVLSAYFIGGLYLVAGVRFDSWNHGLLWCIPLLVFVFSIYYSVSAIAGVVWRNAILCVVMAVVFWGACRGLKLAHDIFNNWIMTENRIDRLANGEEAQFATFGMAGTGGFKRRDEESGVWVPAFAPNENETQFIASAWGAAFDAEPVWDPKSKRLLAVGNLVEVSDTFETTGPWLLASSAASGWQQEILGRLPQPVSRLLVRGDGQLVGLSSQGIVEIPTTAKPLTPAQLRAAKNRATLKPPVIEADAWALPAAAATTDNSTDLVVYDPGRLRLMQLGDAKRYTTRASFDVLPATMCDADALAFAANRVVLGTRDGRILVLKYENGRFVATADFVAEGRSVKQVRILPDGSAFAVLFHDQRATWFAANAQSEGDGTEIETGSKRDITAIAMSKDGKLTIAHAFNHLTTFDAELNEVATISPSYNVSEAIFWYGVRPLYKVLPKPVDLVEQLTAYFVYDRDTIRVEAGEQTIEEKLDIYTPIWSNLAFLAVMLGAGCWYVSRRDF
jgi:hypothetical protein